VVGDTDVVLGEAGVFVTVRICHGRAETLKVVMRDLMRVSPQRREFQSGLLGFEGERVHLDRVENVLPAKR